MKILFISYRSIEYDGRLRELLKVSQALGETHYITKSFQSNRMDLLHHIFEGSGVFSYFKFIKFSIYTAIKISKNNKFDIIFADDRKGIIPVIIIKKILKIKHSVLDCRETYILSEANSITNFIGCLIEKLFNNKFDILIVANLQRANFMTKYYNIKNEPLIFENIRKLSSNINVNYHSIMPKYNIIFDDNCIKIIVTDGTSMSKEKERLINAVGLLGSRYKLIIAGKDDKYSTEYLNKLIEMKKYNNIFIIGLVNENELKCIVGNCSIGFVGYPMDTFNNKYCASGKIYEFIFEGLPVIASKNPPLLELCNKYKIGISTEDYTCAILEISSNYKLYKENVLNMQKYISPEANNEILLKNINNKLKNIIKT